MSSPSMKQEMQSNLDCDDDSCPASGSNFDSKRIDEYDSMESNCINPSDFLVTQLEAPSV